MHTTKMTFVTEKGAFYNLPGTFTFVFFTTASEHVQSKLLFKSDKAVVVALYARVCTSELISSLHINSMICEQCIFTKLDFQ